MRYAILSDIHGNLAAFEAVLDDLSKRGGFDHIWCLGDIVGYGPDPSQCIQLLRQYDHTCVAGNHDWAAVGNIPLSDFNPDAAIACRWTAEQLSQNEIDYLKALPLTLCCGDFTLAHGSPREPIWEYLLSTYEAAVNFHYFDTIFCLIGHSHVPLVFESLGADSEPIGYNLTPETSIKLGKNRLIINPGGIGQPRDGDPRASYALYDSDSRVIWHYRVPYDIATTQEKMMRNKLPRFLITRLSYGF